jgi:hypothetical protein
MNILLILNNTEIKNFRVMVRLTKKEVIRQVVTMMEQDRTKEVFDLVMREAEGIDYFPAGKRLSEIPAVTLTEDGI